MAKRAVYLAIIMFLAFGLKCYPQETPLKQVTVKDSTRHGFPDWSPCGKYIFYGSSDQKTCNTMRIPVDGGKPTRITDYFTQHSRCSPDGKYLVFDAEFGSLIQICPSAGGNPIRIVPETIPINRSGMPCWSPDGKVIAFHSNGVLWTVELGKGHCQKIYEMEKKLIVPFDWTPDGNFIIADVRDRITRGDADIWKIPLYKNMGEAKQLTFLKGYQVEPNISPDGSLIVFSSWKDRSSSMDLYIISSGGGESVQITFDPSHEAEPCWSPDGKRIAFSSNRSGYSAIWTIEPDVQEIKNKLKIE
jgi:Tol biopolymer transport system component